MAEHSPGGVEPQDNSHPAPYPQHQVPGSAQPLVTYAAPPFGAVSQPVQKSSTLGVLALIAGILAFLLGFIPVFGVIVALAAVALSIIALIKQQPKGLSISGLVLGGIALLTSLIMTVVFAFAVTSDPDFSRGVAAAGSDTEKTETPTPTATAEEPQESTAPEKSEEPAATEKPKPESKPEPRPELGTVEAPFSQPYVAKGLLGGEKYKLRARVVDANAAQRVKDWNMFNPTAPSGFKYVVVKYTMVGIDPDGVDPSLASFDMSLATKEGNRYDEEFLVLGDGMTPMTDGPKLYPGSKFSGFSVYIVPKKARSFLVYDNGNYVSL